MARQVSVVVLLVLAVLSCAFAGEISRKTAEAGTIQLLDIPKAGAASIGGIEGAVRKFSKKTKAADEEGTVQMLDIPAATGGAASAGKLATKKAAEEDGAVQMLDVKAATAPAAAVKADKAESSEGGVKFLNILKPLSNLFGSGDTTTSTTVPKPATGASAGAVQFLEPAATTSTSTAAAADKSDAVVAAKPAAGTVQLLDADAVAPTKATTAASSAATSAKPQFVDLTSAADANTLVGASAATKAKTSYLRKSENALAAAADSSTAVASSPKYTKSFSTGAYAEVTDTLQKKILQTGKALDASETLEGSLKLADLLVKLSEALNNLAGK